MSDPYRWARRAATVLAVTALVYAAVLLKVLW